MCVDAVLVCVDPGSPETRFRGQTHLIDHLIDHLYHSGEQGAVVCSTWSEHVALVQLSARLASG